MATLTVGPGLEYATIAAAIDASQNGDVVDVMAGTYTDDFATITTNITLQGIGGMVDMVADTAPPNGKAILTTDADVTISHFAFSGAAVADDNGAGIRDQGGNLTLEADDFDNNQEGLLVDDAGGTGTVTILSSEFGFNGAGNGTTHNIYVGDIGTLTIKDSFFHDAVGGNEIKSRAQATTITDSRIIDGATQTAGGYDIDLSQGGVAVIADNVIEKGANEPNARMISFGPESPVHADSTLLISGNTLVNDDSFANTIEGAPTRILYNAAGDPATIEGNSVWNIDTADAVAGIPVPVTDTTNLAAEPSLDTSTPYLLPAEIDATLASSTIEAGGSGNPFAGDQFVVTDDGGISATLTWNTAQGTLLDVGEDNRISVSSTQAGTLVVAGPASAIATDIADGVFVYHAAESFTGDQVTLALDDPNVFLVSAPGDAATVTPIVQGTIAEAACFAAGTRIATPDGECPIEALAVGDLVATIEGAARPIRWIGRRAYSAAEVAGNPGLRPILIRAGALADGVPCRELRVSARHALWLDGALVPAERLVDGVAIRRGPRAEAIGYYHIELDEHRVVIADGAPAETFVDCDNRWMFQDTAQDAPPDGAARRWRFRAPRLEAGPELAAIRARLASRASGWLDAALTDDPRLRLIVAAGDVLGEADGSGAFVFRFDSAPSRIRLASRHAVPWEIGDSADIRRLGVAVREVRIESAAARVTILSDSPALRDGFHGPEPGFRWTDGDGHVEVPPFVRGPCTVTIRASLLSRYPAGAPPLG